MASVVPCGSGTETFVIPHDWDVEVGVGCELDLGGAARLSRSWIDLTWP